MSVAEFDKFARDYEGIHQSGVGTFNAQSDFFFEYKVRDTRVEARRHCLPESLSILDFGCGTGNSIPFLNLYFPGSRITGLDVSKESLTAAEQRFSSIARFVEYDGADIPLPENSIDLVFTACVFHHIPWALHSGLFSQLVRVLKPGGMIIVFEHNPINPMTVHIVRNCPLDKNARLIRGGRLTRLMEQAGFDTIRLNYRLFFPERLCALSRLEKWISWLPFGAQYYVCAQKPASTR